MLAGVLGLVVAGVLVWAFWPGPRGRRFPISRSNAAIFISIVEVARWRHERAVVRNEVEGTARIIYIVPEGSYAWKGQLLVNWILRLRSIP